MENKALVRAMKVCWEHKMFVVVKPITKDKFRLAISRNGKEKVGEKVYENKPVTKILFIEANGKKYRQEVVIPSVHQMIETLYMDLYEKNFKGMEPAPVIPVDFDLYMNNKAIQYEKITNHFFTAYQL
jgi:hypothetical protein